MDLNAPRIAQNKISWMSDASAEQVLDPHIGDSTLLFNPRIPLQRVTLLEGWQTLYGEAGRHPDNQPSQPPLWRQSGEDGLLGASVLRPWPRDWNNCYVANVCRASHPPISEAQIPVWPATQMVPAPQDQASMNQSSSKKNETPTTEDKKHVCATCGRAYKKKHNLNSHLRGHVSPLPLKLEHDYRLALNLMPVHSVISSLAKDTTLTSTCAHTRGKSLSSASIAEGTSPPKRTSTSMCASTQEIGKARVMRSDRIHARCVPSSS